jgi:starvation-inducible DNA-binding protein
MNETLLFIFGLIATIAAIGPLVIAGISEQQSKKDSRMKRATALPSGTVMAAVSSRLSPYPQELVQDMATVRFLADQMAQLAQTTRAAADQAEMLHDMGTNDLFIEIVRDLDKWLWFLEAHLQA